MYFVSSRLFVSPSNKDVVIAIPYAKSLQLPISSAADGQVSSQMQPTLSSQAALLAAARDNHPQTAKDLIEKGAKIDKETII